MVTSVNKTVLAGEGTQENPYLINNISDLVAFASNVNKGVSYDGKIVKLAADINLEEVNWKPIGTSTAPFKGKFDGGNHTISNLKLEGAYKYAGLFGYVKDKFMTDLDNPTISNLYIKNAYINTTENNAAGILSGQIFVGTVKNVHVEGTVKGNAKFAGGLVGHVYTSFENCSFRGAVVGLNQSGGIAGTGDCRVYNSYVKGNITAGYWAGGIVGNGQEGTTAVNCYVEGNIYANSCWYYGVGGIAGVAGNGYSGAEIKNNYFNGTVYLAGEKINTPIIGFINAESNAAINSKVVGNSWNTANYPADLQVIITAETQKVGTAAEYKQNSVVANTQRRNNNLIMLKSDLKYLNTTNPNNITIMRFSNVSKADVTRVISIYSD